MYVIVYVDSVAPVTNFKSPVALCVVLFVIAVPLPFFNVKLSYPVDNPALTYIGVPFNTYTGLAVNAVPLLDSYFVVNVVPVPTLLSTFLIAIVALFALTFPALSFTHT